MNTPFCPVCKSYFSITVRRHRCRACLENVCGSCSQDMVDLDGDNLRQRVCADCFERMDSSGLIGQGQTRSKQAPTKSRFKVKFAYYHMQLHVLYPVPFQLTLKGLRLGMPGKSVKNGRDSINCDFIVGDRLVTSLRLTPEKMALSFEFCADIYSPIESFVLVSVSPVSIRIFRCFARYCIRGSGIRGVESEGA